MVKSLKSDGDPSAVHVIGMLGRFELTLSGSTWLDGGVWSSALSQAGVVVAGGLSNRIEAALLTEVLPLFGITVNSTLPSPCGGARLGGRNPTCVFVGVRPVAGSIELKYQLSTWVNGSRLTATFTNRLVVGRRSTVVA